MTLLLFISLLLSSIPCCFSFPLCTDTSATKAISGQRTVTTCFKLANAEEVNDLLGMWFYTSAISFNAAKNPYFKRALKKIATMGPTYQPLDYHRLRTTQLDRCFDLVQRKVDEMIAKSVCSKGTVCSDGWKDVNSKPLLNAVFVCDNGAFMLDSWDTSGEPKTGEFIADKLETCIKDFGEDRVVQVIMDNASNCQLAGRLLEERFENRIVASPCMAHTLDLMMEDWGKLSWVKDVVDFAKKIVNWVDSAEAVRAAFNVHSKKRLVKWCETRFATSFFMLQRLLEVREALERTIVDESVTEHYKRYGNRAGNYQDMKRGINDDFFWEEAETVVNLFKPAVELLRLVDGGKQCMGKVYVHMWRLGEGIEKVEELTLAQKAELKSIHSERWEKMCSKLQKAAYALDPEFLEHEVETIEEVMTALWDVATMLLSPEQVDKAVADFPSFRRRLGSVGTAVAERGAKTQTPVDWFFSHGSSYREIQVMGKVVLGQPVSSSVCEHNWSHHAFIHSKSRNRLSTERVQKLVKIFQNERANMKVQCLKAEQSVKWIDSESDSE